MEKSSDKIFKRYYLNSDTTVVVATSGGPDSMALLHMLSNLNPKPHIICAHVNHNKRKTAVKDQELVAAFCQQNDIIFENYIIENYSRENFHHEARKIRYDFFEKTINKYKADYLFTAHHADDLVETMLMRLVRGSSLESLAGIKEVSSRLNYKIIRPLLAISKEELIKYNADHKVLYRHDNSNKSDMYTRNRYRKIMIPFIKNENPQYQKKFHELSNEIIKQNEIINKMINHKYQQVVDNQIISVQVIKQLDNYIIQKIIEKWLYQYYGSNITKINKKHVVSIMKIIKSTITNSSINLPDNKVVIRTYDALKFKEVPNLEKFKLILKKTIELPNYKIITMNPSGYDDSNYCTKINTSKLKLPLYVTNLDPTAKIKIKNSTFYKKINRILIDEKISTELRTNLLMVVDSNNEVVWIPGIKKSIYDVDNAYECDIILKYH